jgi:Tfp pilus assembly protein PilF
MAAAFDHDWKAAENHLRNVVAGEPASARTHYLYALYYLLPLGKVPEAMERSRLALESDPLSMLLHFGMAWCRYCASQAPTTARSRYSDAKLRSNNSRRGSWMYNQCCPGCQNGNPGCMLLCAP